METANPSRLQYFPVSWFATVMGLAGFTVAWHRAEMIFGLSLKLSPALLGLVMVLFFSLLGCYVVKAIRFPAAIAAEFAHPVKLNFFPTISISLVLLSVALLPYSHTLSSLFWGTGAALHLSFTLYVLSAWVHHTHFEINHISPAWFIPVVGNILVPIAGVGHASAEISWFFFSIGLLFWLVLLTIIFYRMFFHQPLPARLLPTLFILIAPPAAGFISWVELTGSVDAFARILYYTAIFLTLMLLTQSRRFLKLQFSLSWWAYSFPMAAMTIATFVIYQELQLPFFQWLGGALLLLLTLIIAVLVGKTAAAVVGREIGIEE